ncbi:MAG TPA: thioesterase family protein [Thermoanaerobaculia bacterium]
MTAEPRPAAPAVETTIDVEVRYAETDQMGVVHHAEYVVWFEMARTRLCATSGWHYADVERLGYFLMVTGVEVSYRRPARYGETVQVSCSLARLGSRGLTFAYRVTRGGDLLARGTTEHVWIDRASGRPCRTPGELVAAFRRLAGL